MKIVEYHKLTTLAKIEYQINSNFAVITINNPYSPSTYHNKVPLPNPNASKTWQETYEQYLNLLVKIKSSEPSKVLNHQTNRIGKNNVPWNPKRKSQSTKKVESRREGSNKQNKKYINREWRKNKYSSGCNNVSRIC